MFNNNLIHKLVQAFEIEAGKLVLLQFWGEDEDRKILHEFSYEMAAGGAIPIEVQHSKTFYKELFGKMEELIYSDNYFSVFKKVDVVIDICMYTPVIPHENFPSDKMALYREFMQKLFTELMSKEKFIQLRLPTNANAIEANMEPGVFAEKMTAAYDIDYDKLRNEASSLIKNLTSKNNIIINTGKNCILTLNIKGRKWYSDTGTGDMPCGEIYIAPVEYEAEGNLYFDAVYLEDTIVKKVTMEIREGKITGSNNDSFNEFLKTLPQNGNVLSEFGIGLNENIEELSGYAVLDEKMKDTYHIAVGNNTMFGGIVESRCHIDFVFQGEVSVLF